MFPQYFTGIGAQRTGTTWLANYFANHPQVCFSAVKELHYFDSIYRPDLCSLYNREHFTSQLNELERNMQQHNSTIENRLEVSCLRARISMIDNPENYAEYFRTRLTPAHRAFGEITPSYSLLPEAGFNAILKMFPDAHFILILRNPCDRYWSHLKLHEGRFEKFSAIEKVLPCLDQPQYFARTNYKSTLINLSRTVKEEQILILFYEDLFHPEKSAGEMQQVTSFLGIDFHAPDTKPLNASKKNSLPEELRKRIFKHFEFVYQYICQIYPNRIPESWQEDMKQFS